MTDLLAVALGGFLVIVGASHFVVPRYYEQLVPPWLPAPRVLVLASGVVEIVVGAGLLVEPSRALAAWAATTLMAVYVGAHVDALLRARPDHDRPLDRPAGAVVRVTVNVGYLAWAATVAATVA